MDKKEIQEQRMRSYFISSAEQIIKGEGIKALSVRNVAEKAGYSFATLYNHFEDLKDLLCVCIDNFADECRQYIGDAIAGIDPGEERVRKATTAYIRYFVQYPGIFELFFIERMSDIANQQRISRTVEEIPDEVIGEDWKLLADGNEPLARAMMKTHSKAVKGLLLMYINRRIPESYSDMMTEYGNIADLILK